MKVSEDKKRREDVQGERELRQKDGSGIIGTHWGEEFNYTTRTVTFLTLNLIIITWRLNGVG